MKLYAPCATELAAWAWAAWALCLLRASACCCCWVPGAGDMFMDLDLKFISGTSGPEYFCCVMKGCNLAG